MSGLRPGVDLAIYVTNGSGRDCVSAAWNLPDEQSDPRTWVEVSESLGFAICSAIKFGATSVSVDIAMPREDFNKTPTTPGQAAFETWAQEQIGDSGYRDTDNYWDALTSDEKATWDRIALAARRPLDPINAPRRMP